MQPIIAAKGYVAVKLEGTFGTPESSFLGSDFDIKVRDITFTPTINQYQTPFASGRHSKGASVPGLKQADFGFTVDFRPGATAGTPPKLGKALRLAGALAETVITFSADLITSNTINGSINGTPISQVTYASSHAATMAAIASAIQTAGGAGTTATVGGANNRSISITHATSQMAATGFVVAAGASQASVAHTCRWTPNQSKDDQNASLWFYFPPSSGTALIGKTHGAVANCVVTMTASGEPIKAVITGKAGFIGYADGSNLTPSGMDTSTPPNTIGATVTHNSVAQRVGSYELDFGNDPQLKEDITAAHGTGYLGGYIASRNPMIRATPQAARMFEDPVWNRWSGGTEAEFKFVTAASGGLVFEASALKAQIVAATPGDRNGEMTHDMELELHETSGNDEWTITQRLAS